MLNILEIFFENKARTQIDRVKKLPPLHSAVKEGNALEVMICLYRGYSIYEEDIYGNTAWDYVNGNEDISDILTRYEKVHKIGETEFST